ncbi:uncharacterized protein FFB14_15584 [Fusarium fujikuroi]|nr:uncharacterized protein FFB14_15584 [Fusarium fujikuroi]
MNSLQPVLSKIALSPSPDPERLETNGDDIVEFRDGDVDNPRNWSLARKRYVTATTMLLLANGSISSSITAGNTQSITQEFGISNVAAQLTTLLYLLGFCAGPFLFSPLSESYGRQWLLYLTFFLYFCFTFLTAWPPGLGTLLVGGCPAGCFAAGPFAIVPGVLVDLWDKCESGNAMGITICLYKTALTRPWALLFDTISLLCCLYSCIITALQYMLFSICPIVFQDLRGWNPAVSQLPVLGQGRQRRLRPSDGALSYDTTQGKGEHGEGGGSRGPHGSSHDRRRGITNFDAPAVLERPVQLRSLDRTDSGWHGSGDMPDADPSSNTVTRCIGSAGAPIFTSRTFEALGMGGGGSLTAGVAALLAVIPFLLYRSGHTIESEVSTLLLEQDSQGQAR